MSMSSRRSADANDEEGGRNPASAASSKRSRLAINIISGTVSERSPTQANPTFKTESHSASYTEFQDDGEGVIGNPTSYMLDTDPSEGESHSGGGDSTQLLPGSRHASIRPSSSNYSTNKTALVSNDSSDTVLLPSGAKSAPITSATRNNYLKQVKSASLKGVNGDARSGSQEFITSSRYRGNQDAVTDHGPKTSELKETVDNCGSAAANAASTVQDNPRRSSKSLSTEEDYNAATNAADRYALQRQLLQDALTKGNAIGRIPSDLDLINSGLSRSRSINLKKRATDSSTDTTPLLFSQTIESLSRSRSFKRSNSSNKGETLLNLQVKSDDLISQQDFYQDIDEVISEDKEPPYNIATAETELNCFKPKDTPKAEPEKKSSLFKSFSPSFKNFYRAENPKLNKLSGKNFWDKPSSGFTGLLKKNRNAQCVIIWLLFVLLMAMICSFIPFVIIFSRGTESSVKTYLANIKPEHRDALLKDYIPIPKFPQMAISSSANESTYQNRSQEFPMKSQIIPDLSASIAGITELSQLPERYRNNVEIQSAMNATGLKNVFYGVDYAPKNVIYPMCGVSLHDVVLDMALLSQVTSRVRTYGTQCNQAKYVLDSIKTLNLNVSLALGVWIGRDDDINAQQMQDMKNILKSYPRKYFESVYVGNEVLFREDQTPKGLAKYIREAKSFVVNELDWNLPVGTSELGSAANVEIIEPSDIFGSNTHPFFDGGSVINATHWVYDYIDDHVEPIRKEALEKKPEGSKIDLVVSEVGWPYQGGSYNRAIAGRRQMQYFLNHWICESKKRDLPWFYFEAFDEPWKSIYHKEGAKWETEWGIFTADRKLKEGLVFPSC